MFDFHVWITVILPFDETKLVSELTKKGYNVFAAAEDNRFLLSAENATYGIMACRVEQTKPTTTFSAKELYTDVVDIMISHNTDYYSLLISECSVNSIWDAGNVISDKFLSFSFLKDSKNNIN